MQEDVHFSCIETSGLFHLALGIQPNKQNIGLSGGAEQIHQGSELNYEVKILLCNSKNLAS